MRGFAVGQRIDDHSQGTQALVDLLGLLQRLAARASLPDLFATGKIDQEELAALGRAGLDVLLSDCDDEYGVRAGRLLVHVGRGDGPGVATSPHHLEHFLDTRDVNLQQALDVHATVLLLVDGQIVVLGREEVTDPLHVDFHVADSDSVFDRARTRHDAGKNLLHDTRNDTPPVLVIDVGSHHGVRLARTRLAIGKDGAVVTVEDVVDGGPDGEVENVELFARHVEHTIEGERALGLPGL